MDDLVNCPRCGYPNRPYNKSCTNCNARLTPAGRSASIYPKVLAGLAVLAAVMVVYYFVTRPEPQPEPPIADLGNEFTAYSMCQKFVEEQLKAPASAEYPDDFQFTQDGTYYKINSFVDSQNSFGAMLRSDFYCHIRYRGNDEWVLLDLELTER